MEGRAPTNRGAPEGVEGDHHFSGNGAARARTPPGNGRGIPPEGDRTCVRLEGGAEGTSTSKLARVRRQDHHPDWRRTATGYWKSRRDADSSQRIGTARRWLLSDMVVAGARNRRYL